MKTFLNNCVIYMAITIIFLSSCETVKQSSKQDKGVAIGATAGTVIGGILGNNIGKGNNTALGAVIGAVVGGAAGGIIGNKMDRQAEEIKTEVPGAQVQRVDEGITVTFDEKNPDGSKAGIYFATSKFNITDNSKLSLSKLEKVFELYPDTDILIEGHTDSTGSDAMNLALSQKRAKAVADYLIAAGVPAARITTKWYGETQPVVSNTTPEGRASNRRVTFAITANDKMKAEAKTEAAKQN